MLLVLLVSPLFWKGAPPAVPVSQPTLPECPADVVCDVVPAAYEQITAGDPSAYGNYDRANRPVDGNDIRYIVIHDTEVDYDTTMRAFRRARSGASAHYVVDSPDGRVTQVVATKDIAYHAGNYWFNTHSVGIEHVGLLAEGSRWYTEEMYRSSARLVRHLAERFHIPLDREHILGHEEIPGPTAALAPTMHYDPGPYWNWDRYFALLGAPLPDAELVRSLPPGRAPPSPVVEQFPRYRLWPAGSTVPGIVTIAPRFTGNSPPLTQCAGGRCLAQPAQPSNIVYLRSAPTPEAPLLGDPLLHRDGGPGGTNLDDWSAKAGIGQSFVEAGRAPGWTAIWFGGQMGWFEDPRTEAVAIHATGGLLLTPRPGCSTIPVYGAANPEAGAYPPAIEPIVTSPLPYVVPAGQVYLGLAAVRAARYYARFDGPGDPDVPGNHTVVSGNRMMWEISFNHRRAFLDAADVRAYGTNTGSAPPLPCANPRPPARVVTVAPGDNLVVLASRYHVTGGWRALYAANRTQIDEPRLVRPGQVLTLP